MATVISRLCRAERVAGVREAVTCGETRLTYAETADRCRRLGGALAALGLGPGDRVAVIGPNCHRHLELYQGVRGAGMVIVPLNARHTGAELRYALEDAGVRVVFANLELTDLPACVEQVIDLGDGYEALIEAASAREFAEADEDELAGLFYTGGTTGASKGMMLTHRNLLANAAHYQCVWPFGPDTRWLVAAPMFHAAGSIAVLSTVWHGGHHIILRAFDPADALDLMADHAVTHTVALDGRPVPDGEVGEVLVRGPNVMQGYWNKPEQTALALTDGWYHTGDLGYLDDHANVYLVDRAKDMIVTGAENVYGTEVEDALYAHPAVLEAAVFGVPDERWGEAVYAVVVPRAEVDATELLAHCRTRIAGYKVPKQIELRADPLPKSAAGKVLKRQLRAPHWEGQAEVIAGA